MKFVIEFIIICVLIFAYTREEDIVKFEREFILPSIKNVFSALTAHDRTTGRREADDEV